MAERTRKLLHEIALLLLPVAGTFEVGQ